MANLIDYNLIALSETGFLTLFGVYVVFWCALFGLHQLSKTMKYS